MIIESDMDIVFSVLDGLRNLEYLSDLSDNDIRKIAWKLYYAIDIVLIETQSRSMTWAGASIPALIRQKMDELID